MTPLFRFQLDGSHIHFNLAPIILGLKAIVEPQNKSPGSSQYNESMMFLPGLGMPFIPAAEVRVGRKDFQVNRRAGCPARFSYAHPVRK